MATRRFFYAISLLSICILVSTLVCGCASVNAKEAPVVAQKAKGKQGKCNECMKKVKNLKQLQKEIRKSQQ